MKKILYSQYGVRSSLTALVMCLLLALALALPLALVVGIKQVDAAVDVKKGTFYKKTSTGSQAITGVGFTPKAIIFWATRQTVLGNANVNYTGYGFTAGANNSASVSAWSDAGTSSNTGRKNSVTNAIQLQTTGGTDAGQATLTTFDQDGFTLNWATADATAYIIHYYAIGGSDITAATTSSIFLNTTDATRSVSNLSFQPEMLFFLNGANVSATSTDTAQAKLGIGFGDTSATQGGIGLLWEDASNSSDTCSAQRTDQIVGLSNACNTADSFGNIASFDANGFTLNISDLPSAIMPVHFLALQGGSYKTSNILKPTVTGYATTTGFSFQPKGLMLLSRNQVADTTVTAPADLTLGAAAASTTAPATTDQGVISINEPDADGSPDPENKTSTSTIYTALKGTGNTLTGDAAFTRFNSDGFTLNWTTADATADEILYWAIGDTSPVTISGTCKQNNQSTDCTDTGTITVAVNGAVQAQTQTTVAGTWSVTGVTKPASGAVITVFIDGVASSEDRAVAVTKYDGTGDITSVELIEGRLTLGSIDNQTITNANIATYDNSVAGDADVFPDVSAGNDLTVDSNSSITGEELYIQTGDTYRLDSTSSGNATTTHFENNGTVQADGNLLEIAGSWVNNGTFTANTSKVIFNGASAETISGTLNGTSAFNKLEFNNSTGSWTVANSASTTAANATDTFVVKNGTVTLGDGTTGINVEVNGKVVIAGTAGETGTLQTAALTQGATTTVDINSNPTPVSCPNCIVQVGASSGGGQGNLKIRKNTVFRLNPNTSGSASDTGIEVEATGYLEALGTQVATNTVSSFAENTTSSTITVSGTPWTAGQFNNMHVRITATSSLAFGKIYKITDTTASTLVLVATTSATNAPTADCSGNGGCAVTTGGSGLITDPKWYVGTYVHNLTDNQYYRIASTTDNGAADVIRILNNRPSNFSSMATGDNIELTDGIRANDTFEVIDYAHITAESGVNCSSATNGTGEAYIYAKGDSQVTMNYADLCNLGRNTSTKYGVSFDSINNQDSNEGVSFNDVRISKSYRGLNFTNTTNSSVWYTSIESTANDGINGSAVESGNFSNNLVSRSGNNAVSFDDSPYLTVEGNSVFNNAQSGILISSGTSTTVRGNQAYANGTTDGPTSAGAHGILVRDYSSNSILFNNTSFGNHNHGILMGNQSNNLTMASNTMMINRRSGWVEGGATASNHNTYYGNLSFQNQTHGMTVACGPTSITDITFFNNTYHGNVINGITLESTGGTELACGPTYAINESIGVLGTQGNSSVNLNSLGGGNSMIPTQLHLFNSTLADTKEVTISGFPDDTASVGSFDGSFVISKKHDGTATTSIWGDYSIPADTTETPQIESTNKFNYADNSWEKSSVPHGYNGTGTEDTDLNVSLASADLSLGPYHYRMTATSSGACTSSLKFDVFRNTVAVGVASCGVTFTDTNGGVNVSFKIDGGGTPYAAKDSYTLNVFDASNNTNTQKTIGMEARNGVIPNFEVLSGKTLELKGQGVGANLTAVSAGASTTSGYQFDISGTIDANAYSMNYGGGSGQGSVLNLLSGATVTSLDNGSFDNYAFNGATDSFIAVHSDLIGAGTPSNIWDGLSFADTNTFADCNVNASSTGATGFWEFTTYTGAFAGESFDCNDGAADPTDGQIKWTPTINITVSGTIYSDEGVTPLNAAGKTVMLRVGTSTPGFFATTTVAGTGAWRIDNLKSMSANATVRAWLDNDATFRAFSLTKASSTSNIPNLDLYQNRLIVKREGLTVASTTITDLAAYDADNDADIQFRANGGALNVFKDQELHVWAGNPFVPGGAVTLHGNASSGTDGSLHLDDNAAYSAGGVTTLAGNWDADTGSLFTAGGYDVVFNATTTGKTITGALTGANAFATTTFNGSGGGWTFANNASTTGLTITAGALTAPSGLLSVAGQYSNNAGANGFTHNGGTVYFTGTSATLAGTMTGSSSLNHVVFKGPVTAEVPGAPASTASTTPGAACTNVTGIGTHAWDVTLAECQTSNDLYAQRGGDTNFTTNYLKATNFSFSPSIPTDATIDGILVDVERRGNPGANNSVSDAAVRIVKGGTIGATDKSKAGLWGLSDAIVTYGSPTDKWGETWTPSDINASNFGFAIAAQVGGTVGAPQVDMIRVKVHYTTAAVAASSGGVWSLGGNASTTNFTIANGTTTMPSGLLSIAGNYTNSGTSTHNSGTVYLSGTTTQTVAGNLTSPSAFNNLTILNTSGTGDATQSALFSNAVSASSTFTMVASTSAQFLAGAAATSTFQNIDWNGSAAATRAWVRSSSAGSAWGLKVSGTRVASYVNVRDSNACSNDATIEATESVNAGGNACWNFPASSNPDLEQLRYRWFNDDGTENNATVANNTNTALSGAYVGDRRRLRILIPNNGAGAANNITYRLEVASTTCSTWYAVPATATTEHWSMDLSGYVGNGASTTDSSLVANPGGKTFTPGYVMTSANQTSAHTLSTTQFTELEYSVKSTANVSAGVLYCFRVTNAGSTSNFTYTVRPEATILPATQRPSKGGGGGGGGGQGGVEGSGSGPPIEGGAPAGGGNPEGGGSPPPVPGGTPGGGGGGDVGYRGGTHNLAAVFAPRSFERILRAVVKMISFPG